MTAHGNGAQDAGERPAAGRRLLKNALAGAGQAVLSGIVLVVVFRILLERLGSEGIGTWSLIMAWFALSRLADLGLPGGMVKFGAQAMGAGNTAQVVAVLARGVAIASASTGLGVLVVAGMVIVVAPAFVAQRSDVVALLAWAGLATWLSCIAVAIRAGLDAMQRVDLRHGTLVLQNLLLLGGVWLLVDADDLQGVLQAQVLATGGAVMVTGVLLFSEVRRHRVRSRENDDGAAPIRVLQSLLGYGLPFQVTTITAFLLDPLLKLLLGNFAGLSAIAWFEMASRLVGQARAVAVNALEALVPHVAAFSRSEQRARIVEDYRLCFAANLVLASAGVTLLFANLPLIGRLWIGREEPDFLIFSSLLVIGWWISALATPAYFVAQGLGVQRWNVMAHVSIVVITVVCGALLGLGWGGIGVVGGFVLAIGMGNALVIFGLQRELERHSGEAIRAPISWSFALAMLVAASPLAHAWCCSPTLSAQFVVAGVASVVAMSTIGFSVTTRSMIPRIRARLSPAVQGDAS